MFNIINNKSVYMYQKVVLTELHTNLYYEYYNILNFTI
jgi:hypothetical protein